ncbi:glycosyl hydrolase 2 galactose-binding domain-containing protein [Phenylobacterium sp.]|uniref:glycosyl hydrolase 2 galactose-binding domain-containing protein n=1 Tax=Phenylobacterium sp. TaxID=1871053 RepID=UPI002DED530F|nr:glycoside hydrolase family 2 protein [Phenylobacterium sp.]
MGPIKGITGTRVVSLDEGWRLALTAPGECATPAEAGALADWIPARAPGTVAQALEVAGRWRRDAPEPLHDKDAWWRLDLAEGGRRRLCFDGLATLAEVWIDETPLLTSSSMFQPQAVEVEIAPGATLWICFRALAPRLAAKGPRARWRPFMIEAQGLRLVRTTLLGHMGGWCPPIHAVGPWRPIRLIEDGPARVAEVKLRPTWGDDGATLGLEATIHGLPDGARLDCAGASTALESLGGDRFRARLHCPAAQPWQPHTHGDQPLYPVRVRAGDIEIDLGRTGFRRIEVDREADGQGFALKVNGAAVFARGAVWVPPDLVGLVCDRATVEPILRRMREAGMNMVRVTGVGVYEGRAFFELCDELGLLVWHDFMLANFDYPTGDPGFVDQVRAEAEAFLAGVQGSPSLAVLCGGSEVMQQAAMMGLAPGSLAWPLFDDVLAQAAERFAPGVAFVPNTPWGGPLPFVANQGVTHYYGVGAYERPLGDARAAGVRFASECLAFANVPQPQTLAHALTAPAVHDPRWKARVPRDRGASWDFEDVRDHYLQRLYGCDPYALRRIDPALYLDLSRKVSGDVMAAVFAEWRRAASPCAGGLVWLLKDFEPGAGWGLIDALGEPKPCWYALKRVLQPRQVLLTDEGVNGLAVRVLNERPEPLAAELRLAVFGAEPGPLIDVRRALELPAGGAVELSAFDLIGRFFDVSYAYRFGPRAHEAVAAQLIGPDGDIISEACHLLAPPIAGEGEVAIALSEAVEGWTLALTAQRLQPYVHIADAAFEPSDDGFVLLPGETKRVRLSGRQQAATGRPQGEALALGGRVLGGYGLG